MINKKHRFKEGYCKIAVTDKEFERAFMEKRVKRLFINYDCYKGENGQLYCEKYTNKFGIILEVFANLLFRIPVETFKLISELFKDVVKEWNPLESGRYYSTYGLTEKERKKIENGEYD